MPCRFCLGRRWSAVWLSLGGRRRLQLKDDLRRFLSDGDYQIGVDGLETFGEEGVDILFRVVRHGLHATRILASWRSISPSRSLV